MESFAEAQAELEAHWAGDHGPIPEPPVERWEGGVVLLGGVEAGGLLAACGIGVA